jgi:hypothetical protein
VIPHVPVGKVTVSALLPATLAQSEREVEVHAGESVEVKFDLPFNNAAWEAARSGHGAHAAPSASAAGNASPAPSASVAH